MAEGGEGERGGEGGREGGRGGKHCLVDRCRAGFPGRNCEATSDGSCT